MAASPSFSQSGTSSRLDVARDCELAIGHTFQAAIGRAARALPPYAPIPDDNGEEIGPPVESRKAGIGRVRTRISCAGISGDHS